MGKKIKSSLLLTLLQKVFFIIQFLFACNPAFYFSMDKKLRTHISFSSTCFCHYRKYLNNDNISLGTVQIWQNLNELHYYLTLTKSVICQIDGNCSLCQWLNMLPFKVKLKRLKLIYFSLISIFSKFQFKTGTLCPLFLPSYLFSHLCSPH